MNNAATTVRAVHISELDRWVLTWNDGQDESPLLRLRSIPTFLAATFDKPPTIQWPQGIQQLLERVDNADQLAARAQDHAQTVRREVARGLLDSRLAESFGDVAAILGVSRQRIHQLLDQ
ncbi:hypothetical protein GP2_031_00410 [Gordonia paraffinivorans NBRC 108238]|uniref:Transcriptional regulator n=1 Tax=Gordonia paraffinivorans NBRC 108238 TaxID=1223543 RepID=A0ABQ0INV0_9ACTN|nr:hypothetical protein [Gordonia paraffinivorans]GAC85229.1 hypothetical protein GP2_031_00410 [Gordonia paraffinivorans NBRC 108238]